MYICIRLLPGPLEVGDPERLNRIEGFEEFRLKDRVRTNNEINSFIRNMLRLYDRPKRKMLYGDVDVLCANDTHEADLILRLYMSRGYQLITLFPRVSAYYAVSVTCGRG